MCDGTLRDRYERKVYLYAYVFFRPNFICALRYQSSKLIMRVRINGRSFSDKESCAPEVIN